MMASGVTVGVAWRPVFEAPVATVIRTEGSGPVRHPDFTAIESVLLERAPGWGIPLRERVAQAIAEEAEAAAFDPMLVLALIQVESEFQEDATSVVGARGLMQVRPATLGWVAGREGVKLSRAEVEADPSLNVRLGVRYLRYLSQLFGGRLDWALMAYNAGPNRLIGCIKVNNTEPWQNYVLAVRRQYATLKRSRGEPGDWALASREQFGDTSGR
jgi:soluble lytic murein transglycosylase